MQTDAVFTINTTIPRIDAVSIDHPRVDDDCAVLPQNDRVSTQSLKL